MLGEKVVRPIALFIFLPRPFRKASKFGEGVGLFCLSYGRSVSCLVGFGKHFSRLRHLGGEQCSHLESCHHQCLRAVCGLLGYRAGAAAELLEGSLKLRYCTTPFG